MKSSYYNDPEFSYPKYWHSRRYEHEVEVLAIRRLLGKRHFTAGLDIGAGYGRLASTFLQYCNQLTLVEPSAKQRRLALKITREARLQNRYLKLKISVVAGTSDSTGLPASSFDLASIIRVLHHLPDPLPTFREIYRLLRPGGILILEFANSHNFKARLRRRHPANTRRGSIPFVNHHPQSILKFLSLCHFVPLKTLSVSNFRSPFLKKILPHPVLMFLESISQSLLSNIYFGPSIFVLATKT